MSALELLESLATDPDYKITVLNGQQADSELTLRARQEVTDLLQKQGKYWCALFPEKQDDENPDKQDTPEDDEEEKPSES